jgi:hypothetical protein
LDDAKGDYEKLEKLSGDFKQPQQQNIRRFTYYGLGEITYSKRDTNAAVQYYRLYLKNADTNSAEARFVENRLKTLQPGSP